MAQSKFKSGDKVKILRNDIQPQMKGKVGKVKKVYESFSDECDCRFLYRIEVEGVALRGVAAAQDLEAV